MAARMVVAKDCLGWVSDDGLERRAATWWFFGVASLGLSAGCGGRSPCLGGGVRSALGWQGARAHVELLVVAWARFFVSPGATRSHPGVGGGVCRS